MIRLQFSRTGQITCGGPAYIARSEPARKPSAKHIVRSKPLRDRTDYVELFGNHRVRKVPCPMCGVHFSPDLMVMSPRLQDSRKWASPHGILCPRCGYEYDVAVAVVNLSSPATPDGGITRSR